MQDIIEYFTDIFHLNNHYELPLTIVNAINSLDRVERGELKSRLFNEAKRLGIGGDSYKAICWLENAFNLIEKNSFRMHEVLFSPGKDIPENIAFHLNQAKKSLDLCVFTISDEMLGNTIKYAQKRGIKVRLITDDNKMLDVGSQIKELAQSGISVKIDHSKYHMHHKFGIIDNRIVFTGSYNWTYTAQNYNQENLLITTNYTIVHQFSEEFEKLWQEMFWLKVKPRTADNKRPKAMATTNGERPIAKQRQKTDAETTDELPNIRHKRKADGEPSARNNSRHSRNKKHKR